MLLLQKSNQKQEVARFCRKLYAGQLYILLHVAEVGYLAFEETGISDVKPCLWHIILLLIFLIYVGLVAILPPRALVRNMSRKFVSSASPSDGYALLPLSYTDL